MINPDETMESTISVEDQPYDATAIDENQIAVSDHWNETISIVDVRNENVNKTLCTENEVTWISYTDGQIIFCVLKTGIQRLNINTETIYNVINDETVSNVSHVVASNDRICYTCPDTSETVTVLDSYNNVIFEHKDSFLLINPWGVTTDIYNDVYVTGHWSNTLFGISPDGKKVRQLLGENDGLRNPTGVHYDCHTNQLIVVAMEENSVHTYYL